MDSRHSVFIALGNRIRRLDVRTGLLTTVAGNGTQDFCGDGGPATDACLSGGVGVAVDADGNLFIAEAGSHRVRRVEAATGTITTVAGNGNQDFCGDGGPATDACLNRPTAVAVGADRNLFIADSGNRRIRGVDLVTGIITTLAGSGRPSFCGDGGPATDACLSVPEDVAVDVNGNLFIADRDNDRIRRVEAATGIITTVAGSGRPGLCPDGVPATSTCLFSPRGVGVDVDGNLFIADSNHQRVRRVDSVNGIITTVAGGGRGESCAADGVPATDACVQNPAGVGVDADGNLFIADAGSNRVREVEAGTEIITTVAGNGTFSFSGDEGPATRASLNDPSGVALDSAGNLFIGDYGNMRVRRVDLVSGIITTVAGNGTQGVCGDGGPAVDACLSNPFGVAADATYNVLIADSGNSRIRRISATTGIITTVVGSGTFGFCGDGGPAADACLGGPLGVAVDAAGNLFIADSFNERIRRVDAVTSIITTVAGNGIPGFCGDGGPATDACMSTPNGLALDAQGNIFIAEFDNNRIRRVDAATGIITTVAGNGIPGFCGDGGPATDACMLHPMGVAADVDGKLFIAEFSGARVRRVDLDTGIITTVAGNGTFDFCGEGGPAIDACVNHTTGVVLDSGGNLFIAEHHNKRIRRVSAQAGP